MPSRGLFHVIGITMRELDARYHQILTNVRPWSVLLYFQVRRNMRYCLLNSQIRVSLMRPVLDAGKLVNQPESHVTDGRYSGYISTDQHTPGMVLWCCMKSAIPIQRSLSPVTKVLKLSSWFDLFRARAQLSLYTQHVTRR